MRIHNKVQIILLLLMLMCSSLYAAEEKAQPVLIEAGQVVIDEVKGISIYSGNVRFQQGGMELLADNVVVHTESKKLTKIVADGAPVKFNYRGEKAEQTEAQAKRMEYLVGEARLIMLDEAQLWQGGNHFSGGRIEFDTANDRVLATRSDEVNQPVRVIIHPSDIKSDDNEELTSGESQKP